MKLKADGTSGELRAGVSRPFEHLPALLDVLRGGALAVVERQHPIV